MRCTACRTRTLTALCCLMACGSISAQSGPYWLGLSENISHDNNLYRLSSGAAVPGGLSRGDTTFATTLFAGLDQPIGRQRVRADASLRASRFSRNESLNHEGYSLKLGADWATIERLSGTVNLARERSLVRFSNDLLTDVNFERNIVTHTSLDATVRVGVVTRWSAELTLAHQLADYSAASYAAREYRQNSVSTGLRYTASGALSLAAALRATQGRYPRFARSATGEDVADRYQSRNLDLSARWNASGVSQVDARLSLGKTSFDRATASDFSGITGSLGWIWRPTGKLRMESRLTRDRGQDGSALYFASSGRYADFSRHSTALSLAAGYEVSSKITLTAGALIGWRDLVDTRTDLAGTPIVRQGSDRTSVVSLSARWTPQRSLTLGCDSAWEQRHHSGPLSTDYSVNTISCFGQFVLR